MKTLSLHDIRLSDGFWKSRTDMIAGELIPYQWETLNNRTPGAPESHAVENFRIAAGESTGQPKGIIFHDSDVAKWIEAASYSLISHPNAELEATIDELVRLVAKSQQPDGYVNTFFIAAGDEHHWSDLKMGHELYCAGHMMEASVAYFAATGKRDLLDVMCRFADHIAEVFGTGEGQNHSFGGHPEIELALYRLAEASGESRYKELADYFVDVRGTVPDYHIGETADPEMNHDNKWFQPDYYLAHKPTREMTEAEGHAVRAVYLYTAMADYARQNGDRNLTNAVKAIWRNTVDRRLYLTGGLGSQGRGERFTTDFDLPGDTAYNETCAAVGLVFWAWRMTLLEPDGEYGDIIERALYNGALSGMSLDGKKYFYVNPLEIIPNVAEYRYDHDHVETARKPWFDCACCPTNIARLVASVSGYAISWDPDSIWIHQYINGVYTVASADNPVQLDISGDYPWDGNIRIGIKSDRPQKRTLRFRIPGWCSAFRLSINGQALPNPETESGFLSLERTWETGDMVELTLDMPVVTIFASEKVPETAGKAALMRGPMIFCIEEQDNQNNLHQLLIDPSAQHRVVVDDRVLPGGRAVLTEGFREASDGSEALYRPASELPNRTPQTITAVPYFTWGNREQRKEMRVWIRTV